MITRQVRDDPPASMTFDISLAEATATRVGALNRATMKQVDALTIGPPDYLYDLFVSVNDRRYVTQQRTVSM